MKQLLIVGALLLALPAVYAQNPASHSEGLALGKNSLATEAGRVSAGKINGKDSVTSLPFYQDKSKHQDGYTSGSIFNLGAGRINACKTETPGADKMLNQECKAVNFLASNPNPANKFDLTNDPAVIAGRIYANDAANMGGLVSESACVPKTTTTPAETSIKTCSEYVDPFEDQCPVFRVVQKQPQTNYMCDVTFQAKENKTCDRRLSLACDRPASCGFGGVLGTPFGDMQTKATTLSDGNYMIEFGVIGDNYWGGDKYYGTSYERRLNLTLQDISAVKSFTLTRAKFDDWLLVAVNGTVVYVGPYGGDRLEQVYAYGGTYNKSEGIQCIDQGSDGGGWVCFRQTGEQSNGDGYSPIYQILGSHYYCDDAGAQWRCDGQQRLQTSATQFYDSAELATEWDFNLSINVLPFLKEGENVIYTKTIVANRGESYIAFTTQMACPLTCKDVWEDHCGAYESRTKP